MTTNRFICWNSGPQLGVRCRFSDFDSDLQVPSDYVAAEPSSKKCHKIKGTAWPNHQHLLQDARAEHRQKESKIKYMEMEESGGPVVIP